MTQIRSHVVAAHNCHSDLQSQLDSSYRTLRLLKSALICSNMCSLYHSSVSKAEESTNLGASQSYPQKVQRLHQFFHLPEQWQTDGISPMSYTVCTKQKHKTITYPHPWVGTYLGIFQNGPVKNIIKLVSCISKNNRNRSYRRPQQKMTKGTRSQGKLLFQKSYLPE